MKKLITAFIPAALLVGCASGPVTLTEAESPYSSTEQQQAQEAFTAPADHLALKRKVAVARISNETTYGKGLLSENPQDRMTDKVSDMFVQGLLNSGNYLIFERPDIDLIKNEAEMLGTRQDLVGVDTLVIGSLSEFGRSTTGTSGFLSSTKKQQATATIDLRLVDVTTGQVIHAITGTGISSTETKSTLGFGSVAAYDGSINDRAIGAAVNAAVAKLDEYMLEKPWSADILAVEDDLIYISSGRSSGVQQGMQMAVFSAGKRVKSATTGGVITLPGQQIATIEILSTFGDPELEEGSVAQLVSGTLEGLTLEGLTAREVK